MFKPSSTVILLSVLAIAGCQNQSVTQHQKTNATAQTSMTQTSMTQTSMTQTSMNSHTTDLNKAVNIQTQDLKNYHWKLVSATDNKGQPIAVLNSIRENVGFKIFHNTSNHIGDSVYFSVGCNSMQADYELKNNILSVGSVLATEMYCEQLDAAERLISHAMSGDSQLQLNLKTEPQNQPVLQQTTEDNMTLIWQGRQTPESKYNQTADTVFWEIDNVQPLCPNGQANSCLTVRPVYYDEQGIKQGVGDWDIFVDKIEGYSHNSNLQQIVRLKRFVTNPTDVKGKQFVYVLDAYVESSVAQ